MGFNSGFKALSRQQTISFSELLFTAEETYHDCRPSATCRFGISRRTELAHNENFWHDGGTMVLGLL